MNDTQNQIAGWAVLELFGHQMAAGYVETITLGTAQMFRLDVPEQDDHPPYTEFYSPGALYRLTLVTEEVCKATIERMRPRPVHVVSFAVASAQRQLEMPGLGGTPQAVWEEDGDGGPAC